MADFPSDPQPVSILGEGRVFKTRINEAGYGSEQRLQQWAYSKRKFKLRYIYEDFRSTIWAFAKSKNGSANSFTFNPHDFLPNLYNSEDITMRFASDEIGREVSLYGFYGIEVELIEVM